MKSMVLIAHNLRSSHNAGSLLRTAEGLGVDQVFLTGYSPYPLHAGDSRLPHIARKVSAQISKTALGAEDLVAWRHEDNLMPVLDSLKQEGYVICAVEQDKTSIKLPDFKPPEKLVLIVGREVEGLEPEIIAACDHVLEIPMFGHKESFNVVQAAAIAMYHCRFSV